MMKHMLHRTSVTILLGCLTAGCTTLTPDLKPYTPPMIVTKKIPLKIALMVPPEARNLTTFTELPTACLGGITVAPVGYGTLFEQTTKDILSQVYEQVDSVQSVSEESAYSAILEAAITKVGARFGCPISPESYLVIDATLRAVDLHGKEVWRSRNVTKRQDFPLFALVDDQSIGKNISATVGALVSDWVQELQQSPTKQWAKGGGTESEEMPSRRASKDEDRTPVVESDVDHPPVGRKATKKNAYAVVIGIEKYREKLPKADFAAHDAKVMGEYLTKVLGYPEENVVVRVNDRAARNDLEKYFGQWLKNNVEPGGSVFIYYSGHGAPNPKTGEAFLVPYDGDPTYVEATAFPLKRLYDSLNALPAKDIVVVLDSCFSGAGGRSVLPRGAKPMVVSVESPALLHGKAVVLAASSGDQMSSAYEEKGHGLLTYFFLKGLQGYADTDEDGRIGMAELYEYLKPRVQKISRKEYNNEQTPQLLMSPEQLRREGLTLVDKK